MDDLIRGGQVTFHKIRMFMQLSKLFAHTAIILFIVSLSYSYYENISAAEWKIGFSWLKKDIIRQFNPNAKIAYSTSNNQKEKLHSIKFFENDPKVIAILEKFEVTFYKGITIAAIMLSLVIGSLILYFWLRGRNIKKNTLLRGMFLIKEKELKNLMSKHNKSFKSRFSFEGFEPFKIANFAYPISGRKGSWSSGEQSHTMIIGSTGSGKTKIIQDLVHQLYKRNQKVIIVDVKGDYIEYFYRENRGDIILNPLDKRGRNWSIFKETNPLKGFSGIARSLLPKESKNDPIWVDSARNVFAELANLYINENLSMAEFADKILKTDLKILNKLLENTGASKVINPDIEKAALSVLMVLSTYLRSLKLYQNNKDVFSITDWVNDKSQKNFLFISSRADVKEDVNPLITAQVDIAINALRSLKEESNVPKTWFILDEIPYFEQPIPNLKDGLAMSRSYGGCFVLGTQDMSSIAKIYSEETARSIANNCRTKIYMNIAGKEAAQWCSASLSEGEIEEWHEGLSYGAHEMRDGIQVNRNRVIRSIVLPSELMLLKTGEGYINFAGFKPAKFIFKNCSFEKISKAYVENQELLEIFTKELELGEKRRKEIEVKLSKNSDKDNQELEVKKLDEQQKQNKKNQKKEKDKIKGQEREEFEISEIPEITLM